MGDIFPPMSLAKATTPSFNFSAVVSGNLCSELLSDSFIDLQSSSNSVFPFRLLVSHKVSSISIMSIGLTDTIEELNEESEKLFFSANRLLV